MVILKFVTEKKILQVASYCPIKFKYIIYLICYFIYLYFLQVQYGIIFLFYIIHEFYITF